MAEAKTKPTKASVTSFINSIESVQLKKDCKVIQKLMTEVTGKRPKIWGSSIIGYGEYHYTYASGREGDWPITGFSPRKSNLTIYVMPGFKDYKSELKKLGKHKIGSSCLYIKKIDDIDLKILKKILKSSVVTMRKKYPCK
ncbi:MAG: DUF1801 domain-containing protein [Bacteriovoracaceae bacterium]|jgi:hypothetical protein|nr:DUF1801 domain-containing protein [Bacteriovoracaceae bacterium]